MTVDQRRWLDLKGRIKLNQPLHIPPRPGTVNVVIFAGGKISRKCWQDILRGGNFHNTTHISFIKAYGIYFRVGVIFAKKTKVRKMPK